MVPLDPPLRLIRVQLDSGEVEALVTLVLVVAC